MQLQRSLFSFYKVFLIKTPVCLWILLGIIIAAIISWETVQLKNSEPVYNFEECFAQYYNATRPTQKPKQPTNSTANITVDNNKETKSNTSKNQQQVKNQVPFNLESQYYNFLNKTSTLKIFLSDKIPYSKQSPSCLIVLNAQMLRSDTQVIQINSSTLNSIEVKQNNMLLDTQEKQRKTSNIKHFNQITKQQKNTLLSQHPFIHLTANSHVVYLDQQNQFSQKHGIQTHAIFLSQQPIVMYPESWLGISSKIWRFHGNYLLSRNQITLQSLFATLKQVQLKILSIKQSILTAYNNEISNKSSILPSTPISPLQPLYLYFHYPQMVRTQQVKKLLLIVEQGSIGVFFKISFACFFILELLFISTMVGLLVRYLFFTIVSLYLFFATCLRNKQWDWVNKYFRILVNRNNNNFNQKFNNLKIFIFYLFALLGILTIFTLGTKFMMEIIFIHAMSFHYTYYCEMLLKNFFIIQLFFYISCRSRVSLKYFPSFSCYISIMIMFISFKYYYYNIGWLINLHLWLHLLLMTIFIVVQNLINSTQFKDDYTPCLQKPRSLYYAGYDISWQNSLPPIWTYFTTYFDLKHFDQKQRSLIDKDYQLLYGRLLGMTERQELPEDQQEHEDNQEVAISGNQNHLGESYQMSLIR